MIEMKKWYLLALLPFIEVVSAQTEAPIEISWIILIVFILLILFFVFKSR